MIIERLALGSLSTNCYLVGDELSREGMVIDPAAEAGTILERAKALKLDIKLIVLTHAHFDHVGALKELKEATKAEIAIHADDAKSLQSAHLSSLNWGVSFPPPPPPDRLLQDGDNLNLGSQRFLVLHTPGHTPGGICLLGQGVVFTGDTLFSSSIGRTDFPGSSYDAIMDSLRRRLMVLPEDTIVYPGHGPETTIGQEKRRNPFLKG